ncbi:gamma-glutamyltransferase family protein [Gluconobacter cerinus]|nr:gamma-glutamyltransferase family protein [Gluconobacter cerinus]MBS1023020.1 gamma-glutamyltransferase family protein [Gluconobacter cerinus]
MQTPNSLRGMVTSPHHLASQAGLDVLKDGGTAIEAIVATAAALAAVYPHMTGLGGDSFWLISYPNGQTIAIDACGRLARNATLDLYAQAGHSVIPWRGGLAANTVAGTVSGWEAALKESAKQQPSLPLDRLLRDAIHYASTGRVVSESEAALLKEKQAELCGNEAFRSFCIPDDIPWQEGEIQTSPILAATLRSLAHHGLRSFYEGDLAKGMAADLEAAGSPLRLDDFLSHRAEVKAPLDVQTSMGTLYNMAPPTQGAASLLILALEDRLPQCDAPESYEHLHGLIEATKQAFRYRNREIDGRSTAEDDIRALLQNPSALDEMAARISMTEAFPWTEETQWGDTTWMGAIDSNGVAVSMIQSLYFEFGSGVMLPQSGLFWQNRGSSFRLKPSGWNCLLPGSKPFHTLNPAAARLNDGRVMVYGTMGGEGQPQTQAAVFSRYARHGVPLQEAICRPRWLLGRTWGQESTSLKLEPGFDPTVVQALQDAGHVIEQLPSMSSIMGHAGAIVRHANGRLEGATDPRSDGSVAAW